MRFEALPEADCIRFRNLSQKNSFDRQVAISAASGGDKAVAFNPLSCRFRTAPALAPSCTFG